MIHINVLKTMDVIVVCKHVLQTRYKKSDCFFYTEENITIAKQNEIPDTGKIYLKNINIIDINIYCFYFTVRTAQS